MDVGRGTYTAGRELVELGESGANDGSGGNEGLHDDRCEGAEQVRLRVDSCERCSRYACEGTRCTISTAGGVA